MRYCPNCGSQISEETKYCPDCGTAQNKHQTVQRNTNVRKRLHCPNCRSTTLTPVIESAGSIGSVGRISRNTAITGTSIENKSFWMCQECGHKFRNLEDLIQENKRYFSLMRIGLTVICGVMVFLAVFLGCITKEFSGVFGVLVAAVIVYALWDWLLKKEKQKKDAEERRLRKACFD